VARGGHVVHVEPARLEVGTDEPGDLAGVGHVNLVEGDEPRTVVESSIGSELGLDDVEVGERVTTGLHGGAVDDVDQCGAALDVPEEVVTEPTSLAGALDEAGNVGDGVRRAAGRHHAEVGHEGGERVVGDLGSCP
jgi:hypothetical protein